MNGAVQLLSFVGGVERAISDAEFALFQGVVLSQSGIRLNQSKKALLVGRLWKRVQDLGLSTFREYFLRIQHDVQERTRMIDLITTNETSFFREPRQFAVLENEIIPTWHRAAQAGQRPRRLRVWSAGCSTGEEPFSLAMVLATHMPQWDVEILATDLSTRAIAAAAEGIWDTGRAEKIPPRYLTRHMLEGFGSQSGKIRAKAELRRMVRFGRVNLHDEQLEVGGPFDLILCRNVLIYFEPAARALVIEKLVDRCHRGGYLFLGHSETLSAHGPRLRPVDSAVWVRR